MTRQVWKWLRRMVVVLSLLALWALALPPTSSAEDEKSEGTSTSGEPVEPSQLPSVPREVIEQSPFFFELPARAPKKPDFNFADVVTEHNLVLYFWSVSCPLCLLQTRAVNELAKWAEEHPEANLVVVSVNLDTMGARAIEQSAVELKIDFPVYFDPGGAHVQKGYSLQERGLPAFYFFLRGGLPVRMVKGFDSFLVKEAEESFLPLKLRGAK